MPRLQNIWIFISLLIVSSQSLFGGQLIGFWHNWNDYNAPYIQLDSINEQYNYIEIAFATPTSTTDMTMLFTPDIVTQSEFITKVQTLKNKGKKVLLSIGGATSVIDLTTQSNKTAFVNSLTNLINTYNFDGLDIDIEHGNSLLITGGTISNPANIAQINLIDAIKLIMSSFRTSYSKKMLLTISPETAYVQGGQSGFGSIWGGYLPIIHALRDSLDILQVQLYNSGTMYGLDGNIYTQGTADFIIAMTEAVIRGFNTNGGFFQGIPANKVSVGLPASIDAAGGGFVDTATVLAAMNYLLGKGPKPGTYSIIQQGAYPDLCGMMTWSINWDAKYQNGSKYQYARNYESVFFSSLPTKVNLAVPANNSIHYGNIMFKWEKSATNISNYQLNIYHGANLIFSDTTISDTSKVVNSLLPGNSYTWKVRAKNSLGWGEWSNIRTLEILALPTIVNTISPIQNELIKQKQILIKWNKSYPQITNYHLEVFSEGSSVFSDSLIIDTTFSYTLLPSKIYEFRIRAKNNSGWGNWSDTIQFSTISLPNYVFCKSPLFDGLVEESFAYLTWDTTYPEVEYYQIQIFKNTVLEISDTSLTDTTYYLSDLIDKCVYHWRVRAKNAFGWGSWGDISWFKVAFPVNELPNIVNLKYPIDQNVLIDSTVQFSWMKSTPQVTNYNIEILHNDFIVFSDSTLSDTTFTLSSLERDKEYTWRVRAKNSKGWGDWCEPWSFIIAPLLELPDIVTLISPIDQIVLNDNLVQFSWKESTPQVTNYNIEILHNDLIVFSDSTLSDTTFTLSSLEYDKKYSWIVRAKNSQGWGDWCEPWVFYIHEISGVHENQKEHFNLTPNPASDYIEINLSAFNPRVNPWVDNNIGSEIKIFNTFGECVLNVETKIFSSLQRLDISHLPVGLYFIQIGNVTEKFVVVR